MWSLGPVSVILLLVVPYFGVCLKIGAFNIRIYGQTKSKNHDVMELLAEILQRYDIVLIQEIRDSQGTAIGRLLEATNAKDANNPFSMEISARLGRTISKEQYAFFYRPGSGVTVTDRYLYDDGREETKNDTFEREPLILRFRSTKTVLREFAIGGVHITPGKAKQEIEQLANVFSDITTKFGINDVMIMGDMNADCSFVTKTEMKKLQIRHDPAYTWWITDDMDTTVAKSSCSYDRFITTGQGFETGVKPGSAKVFRYDEHYKLTLKEALAVSDHYPIEIDLLEGLANRKRLRISDVYVSVIGPSLSKTKLYDVDKYLKLHEIAASGNLKTASTAAIHGTDYRKCLSAVQNEALNEGAITAQPIRRKYTTGQHTRQMTQVEFEYLDRNRKFIETACKEILRSIDFDV